MNEPVLLEALAALGPEYAPRGHHSEPDGRPRFTNRLILESSPYLLQHAHNPVDWRAWSDEAFEEARRRGVPVFLSVGYSTCHWCHVMERESFEDLEIASLLNQAFVPIKLDREERPDVDAIYMEFVQATSGHGGWPMSVFLDADRRPIFGGTYFPARDGDRGGATGFLTLLRVIGERWQDPGLTDAARHVMTELARRAAPPPTSTLPGEDLLKGTADAFKRSLDLVWGGFGAAPKFPRPAVLDFLLRRWRRGGDEGTLKAVELTLTRMACGGIYDHVGGGFARYSVDRQWLVPHFEKMLYDNAQLAAAYLEAWQASGDAFYARVVEDVLGYLEGELSDPAGGFYSAVDADSEGQEGTFYVWTPAQLRVALGADAEWVIERFGVSEAGNFEGSNVLHLEHPMDDAARARWQAIRPRLYRARAERVPPGLDDKVLTSWNALAISAFARAGAALGRREWLERATRAADFVLRELTFGSEDERRLYRSWRRGQARHAGVLEDYAALAVACLDLLEATGEARWLTEARALVATLQTRFADGERGGYFRSPDDGEGLLYREKPDYDGAEPSGNSLAGLALARLAAITGEERYREAAEGVVRAFGELVARSPVAVPKLLCVLEWLYAETLQVVIVTPADEASAADSLRAVALREYLPHSFVLTGSADSDLAQAAPEHFEGRVATGGAPTAYVCRGTHCLAPTSDAEMLGAQLSG